MTRIVCISDTHLAHLPPESIVVPDGDILIHSGDATYRGDRVEIELFSEWFGKLPHRHKVFVPGNHDRGFEFSPEGATALLPPCHVLMDEGVTIEGLKFWGSPWQPEFCDWAFNLPRGPALKKHWDLIPDDTDVLVTHSPPLGMLDRVWRVDYIPSTTRDDDGKPIREMRRTREHVGCADMWQAVFRVQPQLHAFGHIHCDAGVEVYPWENPRRRHATTTFVNAAICDDRYRPVHKPVVVDL